ncbi:MAG: hypothetical protein FWC26_10695 [Fibromonadales bacterium]|nr:hypothetical protein [Fibromonadales bacterium]
MMNAVLFSPEGLVFILMLCIIAVSFRIMLFLGSIENLLKQKIDAPAAKPHAAAPVAAMAAAQTIHPGLSDDKFVAIITAAITHACGGPVNVVKFKPLNTMDWTWAVQGRVGLHTNKV